MDSYNDVVLESFINFTDEMDVAEEMDAGLAAGLGMYGIMASVIAGGIVYTCVKNRKYKQNMQKIESMLSDQYNDFIPAGKMELKVFKASKALGEVVRGKDITEKMKKKFKLFVPATMVKVFYYEGKEIFSYMIDTSESDYYTTRRNLVLYVNDHKYDKFSNYFLCYAAQKEGVKINEAWNWAEHFIESGGQSSSADSDRKLNQSYAN